MGYVSKRNRKHSPIRKSSTINPLSWLDDENAPSLGLLPKVLVIQLQRVQSTLFGNKGGFKI
jgi:hypothetical protein